jgi:O-antigen ligase
MSSPDGRAGVRLSPRGLAALGTAVLLVVGVAALLVGPDILVLAAAAIVAVTVGLLCVVRPEWAVAVLVGLVFTRALTQVGAGSTGPAALALALGLVAIATRRGQQGPTVLPVFIGAAGFYVALGLFSSTWAVDGELAVETATTLATDVAFAVGLIACITTMKQLRWAAWSIIAAGTLVSGLALLQYATGAWSLDVAGLTQASLENIVGETNDYRVGGPVGDANFFGQILVVVLALALERAHSSRSSAARLVAGGAALVTVLAVLITYSRGALIASVVIGGLAFLRSSHKGRTVAWGLAGLVVVVLLAPPSYSARFLELPAAVGIGQAAEQSGIDPALQGRTSSWRVATQMFADHPVAGAGLGNFEPNYLAYSAGIGLDARGEARAPHSLPLQVLAETGILGFATLGGIVLGAFYCLSEGRRRLRERAAPEGDADLLLGYRDALIGYLIAGVFLHAAFPQYLWLLVALCWAALPAAMGRGIPRRVTPGSAAEPVGTSA